MWERVPCILGVHAKCLPASLILGPMREPKADSAAGWAGECIEGGPTLILIWLAQPKGLGVQEVEGQLAMMGQEAGLEAKRCIKDPS